ncbi:MAG: TonB-dependent receptor, partial [Cyclobacteriaceae bacterium]|nr:TonB-dependent receptor [Cyclobacteriaceae bacterium]
KESSIGTSTDMNGNYNLENLPVGNYTISFSYIGFQNTMKTDIIVKPGRNKPLNVTLHSEIIEMESVVVEGGYFTEVNSKPVSAVQFSAEEIRRAPGSAGDVSRILFGLPSLAKVNDQMNSLIVRGGSPLENIFYVDNIEIPNINHFPVQGSSDGPISIINVDFVSDVNFYSGGFSPIYGDRLSSIMDISFREGNKKALNGNLDLSFQGFRGSLETPVGEKGSFMISANRSYLDLIVRAINETGPVPQYADVQGKFTYDFSDKQKLTLFGVWASDYINADHESGLESNAYAYGTSEISTTSFGANLRSIWGKNGYSNTSISYNRSNNSNDYFEVKSQNNLIENRSIENMISLRNVNYYKFGDKYKIEYGVEGKVAIQDFDIKYGEYTDRIGNIIPAQNFVNKLETMKGAAFAVLNWTPFKKLTVSPGGRIDYFDYTEDLLFSPRLSFTYRFTNKTSLNGSVGRFYQNTPGIILGQSDSFKNLKTPFADHYVLGISHLLTESTRLSVEVYSKEYRNLPIDVTKPQFLVFDQAVETGVFLNQTNLSDNGKGNSRGIEVIVQKKLAKDFYGMISGSYSKIRYADYLGEWRDRIYDNQITFTLEGGYKLNSEWEFSARWIYAGGAPFTPYNIEESAESGQGIADVNRINSERLPDYHSLNLRVDKRFHFSNSSIILYLSVWNVYGRENISRYNWDIVNQTPVAQKQWGTLPVFGIEYAF